MLIGGRGWKEGNKRGRGRGRGKEVGEGGRVGREEARGWNEQGWEKRMEGRREEESLRHHHTAIVTEASVVKLLGSFRSLPYKPT